MNGRREKFSELRGSIYNSSKSEKRHVYEDMKTLELLEEGNERRVMGEIGSRQGQRMRDKIYID